MNIIIELNIMNTATWYVIFSGTVFIAIILLKYYRHCSKIEGFKIKMPKFPSANDIIDPIKKPITALQKTAKQQIDKIKGIEKKITNGFKKIIDGFNQGIKFVLFFPQCFLWYMLNVLGYIVYAPLAFFVWVLGLQSFERLLFEYINIVDKQVYRVTGVHPFHFSDEIQSRCYFAKTKSRDIQSTNVSFAMDVNLNDQSVDDSEQIGFVVLILFIGIMVMFGIATIHAQL